MVGVQVEIADCRSDRAVFERSFGPVAVGEYDESFGSDGDAGGFGVHFGVVADADVVFEPAIESAGAVDAQAGRRYAGFGGCC